MAKKELEKEAPTEEAKTEEIEEKKTKTEEVEEVSPKISKTPASTGSEISSSDLDRVNKVQTISSIMKMNKKYGKVVSLEVKQRDPYIPKAIEEKLRTEIMKASAITPNDIAAKYDLRVSAVKKLIHAMIAEGLLQQIGGSARVHVYNPIK